MFDCPVDYSAKMLSPRLLLSQCIPMFSLAHAFPLSITLAGRRIDSQVPETIHEIWKNPSDTLSILLIIGGDIVLKALAQLSGRRLVPVAFSFGWVAYSFNTLMSVYGDGHLMPPADYSAKLFNADSGFGRDNRSWALGRLLRDFELEQQPLPANVALCITVFKASDSGTAGVPDLDRWWWGGVATIVLQLCVSAIPFGLYGDWSIFLVTVAGTILALVTGALPQWRREKWACRRESKKVFLLTGGNGTRNVMVIFSNGKGLDLEDLAGAESPMHAWYLLLVGGLGMLQNAFAAGAHRPIGTSGVHLEKVREFRGKKVMHALMDFEVAYPKKCQPLLREFFPGNLRQAEEKWWAGDRTDYDEERRKKYSEKYVQQPNLVKLSKSK
uniref:Transmembrane protein n=1 Tax=Moniliophthora roreri TaxID=221103 RepID=A0A0W0G0F7_MONRR